MFIHWVARLSSIFSVDRQRSTRFATNKKLGGKMWILFLLLFCASACAQTADNVLVVMNEASPISIDIGMYYAQKRGIPNTNLFRVKTTTEESISREEFDRQIHAPISTWLARNSAQDRILYIVLTKGIPIRIGGTSGKDGNTASVDSELTLLYRRMIGQQLPINGLIPNPYFLNEAPLTEAKQFSHADLDIYLVSRLDGYSLGDIRGLIDRGVAPSREGKILLDTKGSLSEKGDTWLQQASDLLGKAGFGDRVILETTDKVLKDQKQVLGYYSWGSNDRAIRIRNFGFEFVPGALAGMYVSSDGRTFSESADWKIEDSGLPQSLAADLIRDGVTGIAGHVSEPFLDATIRPNILFPAYLSGFNLIESYYMAMPFLSWQTVIIGDPLCTPFRKRSLTAKEIDKGMDLETELPVDFGKRRLRNMSVDAFSKGGIHPDTTKLLVRAAARLAKDNREGTIQALEQATLSDDRIGAAHLMLAQLYEAANEYDKAIERYRKAQLTMPNNPLLLNNLAYAVAVRKNNPQEALPLAEKAYELGKGNPNVADTLGWIYHLAGQDEKAIKVLEEAVRKADNNADIHLHFAIVSAAMGNNPAAEVALKKALEINPALDQSDEVKQLRAILK
jgi:uncharacterized protein (TIGR03790 family)